MTPKDKAQELFHTYKRFCSSTENSSWKENARQCALISAQYLISNTQYADNEHMNFWENEGFTGYRQYWQQVKEEIEKL